MELHSLWFRVRQSQLRFRDLILNQVWRTLCNLGHRLCPRLGTEFAIQPHLRGRFTSLSSHQGWSGFSNELVPAEKASRVPFETIGVALACARPGMLDASSLVTSSRQFLWRIWYLGIYLASEVGHLTL